MLNKIDKFLDKNAMKVIFCFWVYLIIMLIIKGM